ncbi:MAG: NAD(P)H-dependent oxidoreductase [Candidatus Moranbacteria bacterium]|nr:NAD(P)H-dependent oxidoreductase [Candidatus Moranbacteria bacterium]
MNVLIIHASQEKQSFGSAMKDAMLEELQKNGHSVTVSDLYEMKFNPTGGKDDFTQLGNEEYFNFMLEQKNAAEKGLFASDVQSEIEKVKKADLLIINTPVWWFSTPAIVKGWFDRVLATGVAWDFNGIYDKGLLRGKKQ